MDQFYHDTPEQSTKICPQCKKTLPIIQFYPDKTNRTGYRTYCKSCTSIRAKEVVAVQLPLIIFSRICSKCGIEKPIEQFYPQKNGLNGYRANCKTCSNKQVIDRKQEIASQEPIKITTKVCTNCHTEQDVGNFGRSQFTADRYTTRCKGCLGQHNQAYYARNREHLNAYHNQWSAQPHQREKRRAYGRLYSKMHYQEKRAKIRYLIASDPTYREHTRRYHANRLQLKRDEMLVTQRKWRKRNNLRVREYGRRYRTKKRQGTTEKVDYESILRQNNGICYICNGPILPSHKIEFDHVIPISRGGPHVAENIEVVHRACNRRKANLLLEEMSTFLRRGVN